MSKLLILFTVRLNTDLLTSITKRLESQTSAKLASVLGKVLGSAIYNNLIFLVDYGSSALETLLILSSFASMSSIRSLFRLHRRSLKMKPRTEITSESGQVLIFNAGSTLTINYAPNEMHDYITARHEYKCSTRSK